MKRFLLSGALVALLPMTAWADQIAMFGIRHIGAGPSYGIAGADPNVREVEVLDDGTVAIGLATAGVDPASFVVRPRGSATALPITQRSATSLRVKIPAIGPNDVLVLVIEGASK